jgi:hypothetical protein
MRRYWGGLVAAFVLFHGPHGRLVGIDPSDGQIIVRGMPPGVGMDGNTIIETGAGSVNVIETPEEVMQKLNDVKKEKQK